MYESYYGFSAKPFQLSPNPKFFFASSHHRKALSYLEYGISQGEGFIVITGPIGTGKSTIASNLISKLDASQYVTANIVTSNLSPKELLEAIANEFGLDTENTSKSYILREIEHFLIELNKQNRRALILIDEAQNLPRDSLEELRMLSNYQLGNRPLIQSFLLGQEELKVKIQHPSLEQFKQRIIASCHLRAFTERETIDYIVHRLKQVGWKDKPAFSEQALKKVHELTHGVPRKINVFMDRGLLFGYLENVELIDSKVISAVAEELKDEMANNNEDYNGVPTVKPMAEVTPPFATQPSAPSAFNRDPFKNTDQMGTQELDALIFNLNELLERSLEQKIHLTQYIDFLLEKRKELRDRLSGERER